MTMILEDRLARFLNDAVHLRSGKGNGANGTVDVCAVQASDWLAGGDGTNDHPPCVARKIADYVIGLNDSLLFRHHRDLLKPYCAKLVGTAGPDGKREVRRAYLLADYAIRVFAPIWLRADPKHRLDEQAKALEKLPKITTEKRRQVARKAAASAASAADAADAADAAASAASAADAADAADAAASAASAADAADAADAARTKVLAEFGDLLRRKALECLDALLTKHLFDVVRGALFHNRKAGRILEKWLKKHDQYNRATQASEERE